MFCVLFLVSTALCLDCPYGEFVNLRWIVDMSQAVERKAHTVLISSPDRNRYSEFLKLLGTTKLYMPLWSDEEIAVCRLVQLL